MRGFSTQASAPTTSITPLGYLAPFLTIVLWAINTVVTKSAAGVIDPASIALYRWVMAFLVVTPFVVGPAWRHRAIFRAHWWRLAILGALGMAIYQGIAYAAASSTTAINMGVIIALMPLMTALLASAFSAEPLTSRRILGTLISLAGLVILTTAGDPMELMRGGLHIGDLLMLIACLSNSLYNVLIKRWVIPLPIWQQLYGQMIFAILVIVPFWLVSPMSPITAANLPLILFAVFGASIAAPFFWVTGVKALGAARATLFINLLPVIVALLAWSLLGEALHAYHAVGGVIALIGVAIAL
jgi:drug/metabolite transporter (DMT)-like permease